LDFENTGHYPSIEEPDQLDDYVLPATSKEIQEQRFTVTTSQAKINRRKRQHPVKLSFTIPSEQQVCNYKERKKALCITQNSIFVFIIVSLL
jgi:hypothetical protein